MTSLIRDMLSLFGIDTNNEKLSIFKRIIKIS